MKILVLNCGSSSIKYQLIEMDNDTDVLASGIIERVGLEGSLLAHKKKGADKKLKIKQNIADHTEGVTLILAMLRDKEHGVISNVNEISAVGHRVVHGGEKFSGSVKITQEVIDEMEECSELAPLHNPANLKGIYAMQDLLPGVIQCGVFDTSFHQTMPEHAYMYGIPYELYEKYKIRKYGFHGTSHRYVSQKACDILGRDIKKTKIITCHMGNGASIAAIKNGESIETSMGFTPIEGLMMGTRCGDLEPGVLLYLMDKENLSPKEINNLINKKSGVLGITGLSSDMRDVEDAAADGNKKARLALDMYDYRVKKYIGAYAAVMDGVDVIVYTGGIGENADTTREGVSKGLGYLGVEFDFEKNIGKRGEDLVLSTENSKVTVMMLATDEELVIAQDTLKIVEKEKVL